MRWEAFCLDQAEECDLRARQFADPEMATRWRQMADDWREAARTLQPPQQDED